LGGIATVMAIKGWFASVMVFRGVGFAAVIVLVGAATFMVAGRRSWC
jgi:hypothetical protein